MNGLKEEEAGAVEEESLYDTMEQEGPINHISKEHYAYRQFSMNSPKEGAMWYIHPVLGNQH